MAAAWNPTRVERVEKAFPTSACTVRVQTDAGPAYLKAIGSDEGPHILACELVGTRLAKWLGLRTFDYSIIDVTDADEIEFHNKKVAHAGPAFITRAETGEPWSGNQSQLTLLANPEDLSRLVVFDTWTLNCDRHVWQGTGTASRERVNRNNVFLSQEAPPGQFTLKAMDHTHCFTCGRRPTIQVCSIDKVQDGRLFGLFPEFRDRLDRGAVQAAATDLLRMDDASAAQIVDGIPREWDVDGGVRNAICQLIVRRSHFVARTIEGRLWPQSELPF